MDNLMPQACERCWSRKQKCDRVKPTCQQCKSASAACIERRQGNTLNPEDPEAHHSYIESLKRRVASLESRLQSSPAASSAQSQNHARATQTPGSVSHSQADAPQRDSLQAEMGYLPLSAMAELSGEPPSTTTAVSFPTLVQATTSISGCDPLGSGTANETMIGSLGEFHRGLVRQGSSFSQADKTKPFPKFVSMIDCSIPFISNEQLSSEYDSISQDQASRHQDGFMTQSPCKVIRVYMAVATGLLLSHDYRYTESVGTALALTAFQLTPRAFSHASDLEVGQCLTAMTIFSVFSPVGGSPWHLLGLAITRCISAGMHTARVSAYSSDDVEKRDNNRLFWALYILDAVLSTALGRPFCLQDGDISAPIPTQIDVQDDPLAEARAWNIQHARLLHDTRSHPSKGTLFHWSNYKHWMETAPFNMQVTSDAFSWFRDHHYPRASCRGLVAILQIPGTFEGSRELSLIVDQAAGILEAYFDALDKQAKTQDGALTSLDGVEVFAAAIGLISTIAARGMNRGGHSEAASQVLLAVQKPLQLLTRISERFKMLFGFGDVLRSFAVMLSANVGAGVVKPDLQRILETSGVKIPRPTRMLMQRIVEMQEK